MCKLFDDPINIHRTPSLSSVANLMTASALCVFAFSKNYRRLKRLESSPNGL